MPDGTGQHREESGNGAHPVDALRRAGIVAEDVYLDIASGAKSSRPQLDVALKVVRGGDQLVITRLDRLGRSVLHLVTLGAQLRERGVGLRVLEQGIDTATAEGRAMFGMLSVLSELQRGDSPLITGLPPNTPIGQRPPTLTRWLHTNGWRTDPEPRCDNHR